MYSIKCFNEEKRELYRDCFYVLSRGENAGKTALKPWANSFVVTVEDPSLRDALYWACMAMYKLNRFKPHLKGSVVQLIRVADLREVLNEALVRLDKHPDLIAKAVATLHSANDMRSWAEKQSKLATMLEYKVLYDSFIK
jgi:hypothetical protein